MYEKRWPFTTAKELVDAMKAYGHAGQGARRGAMEILRRVMIDVTLAPGGAARMILSDSGRDEHVQR